MTVQRLAEGREGKVLSALNKGRVRAALGHLRDILTDAGEDDEDGGPDGTHTATPSVAMDGSVARSVPIIHYSGPRQRMAGSFPETRVRA